MDKTNVCRLLDGAGIAYSTYEYDPEETDGVSVARLVGFPAEETFKTLVTSGASGGHYVFVIPVCCTLDLKKAARAAGEKSVAMLPQKELLPLTGYIHGGCSPVGMKKPFATFIDETASLCDEICVSSGRRGMQVRLSPDALSDITGAVMCDLT